MTQTPHPIVKLLRDDPRYTLDAYEFVRDALSYAHDVLDMGQEPSAEAVEAEASHDEEKSIERHLSGQQLCEAIRRYALEQYGYMAKVVLNSWGVTTTGDFGEIVYNLISIGMMKKSDEDCRDDFDGVYDFDEAFQQRYKIKMPE